MKAAACSPKYCAKVATRPLGIGSPDAARPSVSTTVSVRWSVAGSPPCANPVTSDPRIVSRPAATASAPARAPLRASQASGPSGVALGASSSGGVSEGGATAGNLTIRVRGTMEISEVMTESVVTAASDAPVRQVAEIMRERNVGSVILVDESGEPVGFITDRDLAVSVLADGHDGGARAADHASAPVVTAAPQTDVSAATELMVSHGIRRLPIVDRGRLTGIVTLDDLAVRIGDLETAASITAQVTRAALPDFYFHDRGG
jgi:CBS domain-containing protein